jgi:hypothetical protein
VACASKAGERAAEGVSAVAGRDEEDISEASGFITVYLGDLSDRLTAINGKT